MKKRDIPEPKRFVADTTKDFHTKIKKHCLEKDEKLKDFVLDAIEEKYERDKKGSV